jgi:hypothetical protein
MKQYLLLIHDDAKSKASTEEWTQFFVAAKESGYFRGGSEIGERVIVGGDGVSAQPTSHIGGFMRFDADDKAKLLELLRHHPVVLRGGSVELCEMPKS